MRLLIIMDKFVIKVKIDNQHVPCGIFSQEVSSKIGNFKYLKDYLKMKSAFPLDLLNLPLSEKAYFTSLNDGYFGIFADMLPQGWNKNMLSRSDKKIDLVKHAFYSNLIIINDNNIIKGLLSDY